MTTIARSLFGFGTVPIALFSVLAIAASTAWATDGRPAPGHGAPTADASPPGHAPEGSVLFSTLPGIVSPSPFTISSQSFTDIPGWSSVGADDFTVTGNGWTIATVEVRGTYFEFLPGGPTGPATSVNVYVVGDAGGLPDTTNLPAGALYAAENLSYTDVGIGDFLVTLPGGGITLLPGTYWLVVQPNMGVIAGGQWGWTESSSAPNSGVPVGAESAWFQTQGFIPPANGGPYTCVGVWGRRVTDCDITVPADPNPPPEPDLAFRLGGTALSPGIALSPTALTTSEAGVSDDFTVVLSAPPTGGATVNVPIGAAPAAEGTVSITSVDFTAANWNVPQTVTVSPVDDGLADGDVAYILSNGPATSGDSGYDGLAVTDVGVVNQDDEIPGITVAPVSGLVVSEDGVTTATFDVALTTPPGVGETVTVPLASDTSVATLSSPAAVLTDTTPVTIVVTGVDDDVDDGDTSFSVATGDPTSTSAGSPYDLLVASDAADPTGTRLDDDVAGFEVVPSAIPLETTEAGASAAFDVRLTSMPTDSVTIALFSDDESEATVSTSSLDFAPGGWDTFQTVTVTGADDLIDDGDVPFSVVLAPAVSADPGYDDLDPADVAGLNLDDADLAGFTITPVAGLTTTEDGGTASFDVRLDTQPVFFVDLALSTSDISEGLISADGVTFAETLDLQFDSTNWSQAQIVTVQGQPDELLDGDIGYLIQTDGVTSGDVPYNQLGGGDVVDVEATNLDGTSVIDVPTTRGPGLVVLALALAVLAGRMLGRRRPVV